MKEIDCRGMACPQPVVTAKKALEDTEGKEFILIVDNLAARDNVERFAKSQEAVVDVEQKGNDFYLRIQKRSACDLAGSAQKAEKVVVYINSNLLGVGEEALGAILMRAFLKTLLDLKPIPTKLIFINSGVRLTSEGSELLETLQAFSPICPRRKDHRHGGCGKPRTRVHAGAAAEFGGSGACNFPNTSSQASRGDTEKGP